MSGTLFTTTEGRLLGLGLALAGVMLLAFGVGWHLFPDSVLTYAAMTGLNLVIGRAAGMSMGYASGLTHAQVIPINMVVETVQVLVVYPLFVLSWRQMIRLRSLQPFVMRMHAVADVNARGGMVKKFGIVGLFVFVFMPLWMTGPVVGAIIGFLIGMRPWVNLSVVLPATYIAIGLWGLLLNELSEWAANFDQFAPYAVVAALVLIAAAMRLYNHEHNHKENHEDTPRKTD